MITKTYTFYWYDMSSTYQKQDRIKQVNLTWSMKTKKELDLYAVYKAKAIGAFKHEEYIR
jgi:hypothetical protein